MSRVSARRHVDGQRWALVHVFANDPGAWLPLPARVIGGVGWLSTVHGGPLLRSVRIGVGPLRDRPDAFTRHIVWMPGDHRGALAGRVMPVLQGQLRIEHRDPPGVTLELTANYRPPGGVAGTLVDAVALHRLAASTVARFLDEIAERMTAAALITT